MENYFQDLRRSPAFTTFLLIWLVSAAYLSLSGYSSMAVFGLLNLLGSGVLILLTLRFTQLAPPSPRPETARQRTLLFLQLLLIVVVILLTAYRGLVFHRVLPAEPGLPLWTPFVSALERQGGEWFGNNNYVANPVLYFLVVFILLIATGALPREIGFGPGHRVWRVIGLWSVGPLLVIAYTLVAGQVTLTVIGARLLSNAIQNGFFEEFLFRGALQTRLRRILNPAWAVVIQALIFGVWHLGLGYTNTAYDGFLPAVTATLVNQAVLGLAFGMIFERTRNLLAPSVVHVLFNSMGI